MNVKGRKSVGTIMLVVLFALALPGLSCMKDKEIRVVKATHENGQEKEVWVFQQCRREKIKEITYFSSGGIEWEREIQNGVGNGIVKMYYENGKLDVEATLKNDRVHGIRKKWHENGQLFCRAFYDEGKLMSRENWDEDGNPIYLDMDRP